MSSKQELEMQVEKLSEKLDEMMGAFRAMFAKSDQNLTFIQNLQQDLEGIKVDVARMKSESPSQVHSNGASVQKY